MNQRQITITVPAVALATLEEEARKLGTSFSAVAAEALVEKAEQIRGRRTPRVGIGRSMDGKAARDLTAEPIARPSN